MSRAFAILLSGVLLAALFGGAVLITRRRRRRQMPELNQHPERLEQMLDPTDDA